MFMWCEREEQMHQKMAWFLPELYDPSRRRMALKGPIQRHEDQPVRDERLGDFLPKEWADKYWPLHGEFTPEHASCRNRWSEFGMALREFNDYHPRVMDRQELDEDLDEVEAMGHLLDVYGADPRDRGAVTQGSEAVNTIRRILCKQWTRQLEYEDSVGRTAEEARRSLTSMTPPVRPRQDTVSTNLLDRDDGCLVNRMGLNGQLQTPAAVGYIGYPEISGGVDTSNPPTKRVTGRSISTGWRQRQPTQDMSAEVARLLRGWKVPRQKRRSSD
jgi:hypothetical protein